jgi:hypothetical protein
MDQVLWWSATIIAVGGALGVIWKVITPVFKRLKTLINSLDLFTRDWFGEEATPGRVAVPGVMERLNAIDGQFKNNGGSSMKDSMDEMHKDIKEVKFRLDEGNDRFLQNEKRIEKLESSMTNFKR